MTREEAIKIIKEFINGTCLHLVDQEALETLIPELKESDDERMLQTIIRGFENCKRNGMETFNNTKIDDILVYLEKQKEPGIKWLKSDNVKNPDKPYIDKAGVFYTTDGRMCYASEIEKQKGETLRNFIDNFPYSDEQKEQKPINNSTREKIINRATSEKQVVLLSESNGNAEIDWDTRSLEDAKKLLEYGIAFINERLGTKPIKCIEFYNEFENQISHLLASVLNGEHEYNKDFVKYASQSLLGYAKNELKSDELNEREKLMKALQTTNAQIGELVEENYKLKEQKPVISDDAIREGVVHFGITQYQINNWLKKHINVVEQKPEWSKEDEKDIAHIIRILDDCYAYGKHDLSKTDHENLVNKLKSFRPQPQQEWNKENENKIERLAFLVSVAEEKEMISPSESIDLRNFIKSLRPPISR